MKKTKIILILIFLASITFFGCAKENEKKAYYFDKGEKISFANPNVAVADKLEVYYFHRTARCYTCNVAEEYISKIIFDYFSDQVKNGIIDYKKINIDLRDNKAIVKKFQATGSSFFINKIIDGKDNIEQDANIWRLINNEVKFKDYLKNKIESHLGI